MNRLRQDNRDENRRANRRVMQLNDHITLLLNQLALANRTIASLNVQLSEMDEFDTPILLHLQLLFVTVAHNSGLKRDIVKFFAPAFASRQKLLEFFDCGKSLYYEALNNDYHFLDQRSVLHINRQRIPDEVHDFANDWFEDNYTASSGFYCLVKCTKQHLYELYRAGCNEEGHNQVVSYDYFFERIFNKHHVHIAPNDFPCRICDNPAIRPDHNQLRDDAQETYYFYKNLAMEQVLPCLVFILFDWAEIDYGLKQGAEMLNVVVYRNAHIFNQPNLYDNWVYCCDPGMNRHSYREVIVYLFHLFNQILLPWVRDAHCHIREIAFQSDGGKHFKCAPIISFLSCYRRRFLPRCKLSMHYKESYRPYDRLGGELQNLVKYQQRNFSTYFADNQQLMEFIIPRKPNINFNWVPVSPVTSMNYRHYYNISTLHHITFELDNTISGSRYLRDDGHPQQVRYDYVPNPDSDVWLDHELLNIQPQ